MSVTRASQEALESATGRGFALLRETVEADRGAGRLARAEALEEFIDAAEEHIRRLKNGYDGLLRELIARAG